MAAPHVSGPLSGGQGRPTLVATSFDLAKVGYEQAEYLVSGTARAFTSTGPLSTDGRWTATPAETAAYTTRVVVHRPVDPVTPSSVVVVEWFNVSAGFDTAPDWLAAHNVMIRAGITWIGVSAQAAGIQGGGPAIGGIASGGLKAADPERYDALHHPGDSFSYDIYSQVARLARAGDANALIGRGAVETVVAIGESQSAYRLVTYLNAVHPTARAFDGFLVHSRGGSGAPLRQSPHDEIRVPEGTIIRDDLATPVLVFQAETDFTELGYAAARQTDTEGIHTWEVAGTAHADAYTAGIGFNDTGDGRAEAHLLDVAAIDGGPLGCGQPINAGPAYAVLQAALHQLVEWSRGSAAPPTAPRLELLNDDPAVFARDRHGNALGGIRTPLVDVPIAMLRGDGNEGQDFCRLFGSTEPFAAATIAQLYPSREAFTTAFAAAADAAVTAGHILEHEAVKLKQAASTAKVPGL